MATPDATATTVVARGAPGEPRPAGRAADGNELDWGDVVIAEALLATGLAISFLIGRWRRRVLGRPGSQSAQMIGLLARIDQILVIAVFAGWALTRLGSATGFLTVVVLVALLIGVL